MTSVNEAVVEQKALLAAISELVEQMRKPQVSADDVLWTFSDIAEYLKLSVFTIETKVVKRPDFPNALQPCPGRHQGQKRWFARDVIEWARRNSSGIPRGRGRH